MYHLLDDIMCSNRQDTIKNLLRCGFSKCFCPFFPELLAACSFIPHGATPPMRHTIFSSLYPKPYSNSGTVIIALHSKETNQVPYHYNRQTHYFLPPRGNSKARDPSTYPEVLYCSMIVRLRHFHRTPLLQVPLRFLCSSHCADQTVLRTQFFAFGPRCSTSG